MQKNKNSQSVGNLQFGKTQRFHNPVGHYIHAVDRPKLKFEKTAYNNNFQELINTTKTGFDPYYESRNMVNNKLLQEERNDIDFYNIQEVDKSRAKKRYNTNFRSIHYLTDKPMVASMGLNLYQYKDVNSHIPQKIDELTPFEVQTRKEMKKRQSNLDNKLLLKEIYTKLEEEGVTKQDAKKRIQNLEKMDVDQVDDLEVWSQKNTAFYKKQKLAKPTTYAQSENSNKAVTKVRNSILRMLTRKGSILQHPEQNLESSEGLKNMIQSKKSRQNSIILPNIGQNRVTTTNSALPTQNDGTGTNTGKSENKVQKIQSSFIQALLSAEKLMKSRKFKYGEIEDEDRDVKKKLNTYVNAMPNADADNPDDMLIDLTADKIAQSYHSRLYLENQQNTIRKLVKFYEKQTNLIQQKLEKQIRSFEVFMSNKTNTIRLLRSENHSLIQKLRKLESELAQLEQELKKGPKKLNQTQNQLNPSQLVTQSSQRTLNSPMRSQSKLEQSQMSQSKINFVPEQETRQMQIEKIKMQTMFKNRITDAISDTKKQIEQIKKKMDQNSEQIYNQESQLNAKKKEFRDLERAQKLFTYEILKVGKDTRNEGLTWVIEVLNKLGEKPRSDHMPDFLDNKAKEFLLLKSNKMKELKELVAIQEMQIDVYKQSLQNQIQSTKEKGLNQTQSLQKSHITTQNEWINLLDQQATILMEAAKSNPQNQSMLYNTNVSQVLPSNSIASPKNVSIGQNQQSLLINSMIEQANQVEQQNFSIINVSKVKQTQIDQKKNKELQQYKQMVSNLSPQQKEVIDDTMTQLFYPKSTSSDVFYDETKKKMRETFKVQKKVSIPKQLLELEQEEDEFSDFSDSENQVEQQQDDILEEKGDPMEHKIVLYENDVQMNDYETKQQFFEAQRKLNKKIAQKQKELKNLEEQELQRIIKEFDYKNYITKYKTKHSVVLCALFGYQKAEREVVRNGFKEQ